MERSVLSVCFMTEWSQALAYLCISHTRTSIPHSAKGLFETKVKMLNQITEGAMYRAKAASAGKPLQSCEVAIFLKVFFSITRPAMFSPSLMNTLSNPDQRFVRCCRCWKCFRRRWWRNWKSA